MATPGWGCARFRLAELFYPLPHRFPLHAGKRRIFFPTLPHLRIHLPIALALKGCYHLGSSSTRWDTAN